MNAAQARQQVIEYTRAVLAYENLVREHLSAGPDSARHSGTLVTCPRCTQAQSLQDRLAIELTAALQGRQEQSS